MVILWFVFALHLVARSLFRSANIAIIVPIAKINGVVSSDIVDDLFV